MTYSVIALSVITLSFAFLDYVGDKEWQKDQINELELINQNLTERNTEIESLKSELKKTKEKILILEQSDKTGKK